MSSSSSPSMSASGSPRPQSPESRTKSKADLPRPQGPESLIEAKAGELEKQTSESPEGTTGPPDQKAASCSWQAIWSPQYNAYYFYNAQTAETTWTNPLQPGAQPPNESADVDRSEQANLPSSSAPPATTAQSALRAAAIAQGIDPSLAYLDPSLTAGPASVSALSFSAKFNARTGAFTRPDGREPSHLSEYERAKRMSEFYFDVSSWENDLAQSEATETDGGKKRKRPSKADLERFKEQKKQKKLAKTAWLRS